MPPDLSKVRHQPLQDYSGVLLKQGAVLLDSDANEGQAITGRQLRALASDVLGRATVSQTTPDAFKITSTGASFRIGKGRFYLDGLLAENHGATTEDTDQRVFDALLGELAFSAAIAYEQQPYLPEAPELPESGSHVVYLEVWPREVTHIEQRDLVESAVGVETSSRLQTVWQVRVLRNDTGAALTCGTSDAEVPGWLELSAPAGGMLTTGTSEVTPAEDACELPPLGGYRGLENQLYRVEIHEGGAAQPGGATFKWSRENASVASRVSAIVSEEPLQLELQTLGRDDVLGFKPGDWIELTDDALEFSQRPGLLRKIVAVDRTSRRVTLSSKLPDDARPFTNPRVYRWDHPTDGQIFSQAADGTLAPYYDLDAQGSTGAIPVPPPGTTLLLERGITLAFDSVAGAAATAFKSGNYWCFAARTADASVERLERAFPLGTQHHYARLGIWQVGGEASDCRVHWPPNTHDCGCAACVTSDSHNSGQFTLQDAVDKIRERGGNICLAPGDYVLREAVRLVAARSICIRGQGRARSVPGTPALGALGVSLFSPSGVFALQDCVGITLENLVLKYSGKLPAVSALRVSGLDLRELVIGVTEDGQSPAISLAGIVQDVRIQGNQIGAAHGVVIGQKDALVPVRSLSIEDNLFACALEAISMTNVFPVGDTFITRNLIKDCAVVAITALGGGSPGSVTRISRNRVQVRGTAIRASQEGLWIEENQLINDELERSPEVVGIDVPEGSAGGPCRIIANDVRGFDVGIQVKLPVQDLSIKRNHIELCGHGIWALDTSRSGMVSIENNQLRSIGGNRFPRVSVGIAVLGAHSTVVAGNSLRELGKNSEQVDPVAGIVTVGSLCTRIVGNELEDIAPTGESGGPATGILLVEPFAEFEISQNRVQRDAVQSTKPDKGDWLGLRVGTPSASLPVQVVPPGPFTVLRLDGASTLVLTEDASQLWTSEAVANASGPSLAIPRGSVLGNAVYARGATPAVQVVVPRGECVFSDNRVHRLARDGADAVVVVTTGTIIVHGNRVNGGSTSIALSATWATVLGNITTHGIKLQGGSLPGPWSGLNVSA